MSEQNIKIDEYEPLDAHDIAVQKTVQELNWTIKMNDAKGFARVLPGFDGSTPDLSIYEPWCAVMLSGKIGLLKNVLRETEGKVNFHVVGDALKMIQGSPELGSKKTTLNQMEQALFEAEQRSYRPKKVSKHGMKAVPTSEHVNES